MMNFGEWLPDRPDNTSGVTTAKNVSTKNPRLKYPAHENQSTTSFSNPFERRIIGIIGKAASSAIQHQVTIFIS